MDAKDVKEAREDRSLSLAEAKALVKNKSLYSRLFALRHGDETASVKVNEIIDIMLDSIEVG
ncbi:hypothetical protein [Labrenzia sp. THAF35]|uniref:hypothetical protein n=1 Tax=Labrenzia sp. THAF35 TaxID=2587854 RepID=UPI00126899E5|nr:hypothetical protein [Labrenzia sp. THAF35]